MRFIKKISLYLLLATLSFSTPVYSQALFHGLISETGIPAAYDADYQAVLNQATSLGYTLPDEGNRTLQNQLVLDLKSSGIWTELDVFWPMLTNINFATLNWKDPTLFQLTLVNSPTYSATTGFTGNASTMYIDTGWIPSSSSKYLLNDGAIGIGIATNIQQSVSDAATFDAATTNGININSRNTSDQFAYRINSNAAITVANASSIGRYHVKRTSSTAVQVFKNGSSISSTTLASSGRSSFSLYILGANSAGTLTSPSSKSVEYLWCGSSLTALEATFDAILDNFYP